MTANAEDLTRRAQDLVETGQFPTCSCMEGIVRSCAAGDIEDPDLAAEQMEMIETLSNAATDMGLDLAAHRERLETEGL